MRGPSIDRFRRLVLTLAGVSALLSTLVPATAAAMAPMPDVASPLDVYYSGAAGYDASWPQCGASIPAANAAGSPYSYAMVGVNHTIAFTKNECLADEASAAAGRGLGVSFYVDVNSPSGASANAGALGPRGICAQADDLCWSYNYGYNSVSYAYEAARQAVGDDVVSGAMWWLDVETGKPWSKNKAANAQVLQGAIDSLNDKGSIVGAYSLLWMWNQIAGSDFRPGIPAWTTAARSPADVPRICKSTSFTGGPIVLVQQPGGKLDRDYAC